MQINELYQSNSLASKAKLWHRNIFILASLSFVLMASSVVYTTSVFILFAGLILSLTKTNFAKLFKLVCIPLLFIAFSCLAIVVNINTGTPIIKFENSYLGYSNSSVMQALLIASKSISISTIFLFYMMSTSISEIATSMRSIKIPCLFIELFILTYKYIFCVLNRSNQLMIAQKSRMAYTQRKGTYKSISLWLSSVFIGSITDASNANYGLQTRAYNEQFEFVHQGVVNTQWLTLAFICLISAQAFGLFFIN